MVVKNKSREYANECGAITGCAVDADGAAVGFDESVTVVDNTEFTPEETADRVSQLYNHAD